MYGICIESSHKKGMGHLFRAINLASILDNRHQKYIVLINNDDKAIETLQFKKIPYEIVDLSDYGSNWETKIINKYGIKVWLNDRLNTHIDHANHVKNNGIKLVTFDDRGTGAVLADINFAGMTFSDAESLTLKGKQVYYGVEYLIINDEVEKYRRQRKELERIMVTLGGSDTYGVTVQIVQILKNISKKADIYIGPSFSHLNELEQAINEEYRIFRSVPSLIAAFADYDLAVTGGGITAFEANASGLPCIIIANEKHEIINGHFLQEQGSSVFAGYYEDIDKETFSRPIDILQMSKKGMKKIPVDGALRIYNKIEELKKR